MGTSEDQLIDQNRIKISFSNFVLCLLVFGGAERYRKVVVPKTKMKQRSRPSKYQQFS